MYLFTHVYSLLTIRGYTVAGVAGDQFHVVVSVDGMVVGELQHLLEGVIDEDEADEGREAFLSEAGEILDQEAGVRGNENQGQKGRPQADPQSEFQIVKAVVSGEEVEKKQVILVS